MSAALICINELPQTVIAVKTIQQKLPQIAYRNMQCSISPIEDLATYTPLCIFQQQYVRYLLDPWRSL